MTSCVMFIEPVATDNVKTVPFQAREVSFHRSRLLFEECGIGVGTIRLPKLPPRKFKNYRSTNRGDV